MEEPRAAATQQSQQQQQQAADTPKTSRRGSSHEEVVMSNMAAASSSASDALNAQPPAGEASASSPPPPTLPTAAISFHVREATPSKDDFEDDVEDDLDEDIDADDESSSFSIPAPKIRVPSAYVSRSPRERSVSAVAAAAAAAGGGSLSSSPNTGGDPEVPLGISPQQQHHLDLTLEPAMKRRSDRRSISAIGPLSISPPSKTPRSGELEDLPLRSSQPGYGGGSSYHSHHHHRPSSAYIEAPSSSSSSSIYYSKPPLATGSSPRESRYSYSHHRHGSAGVRFRPGFDDLGRNQSFRYPYSDLIVAQIGGGGGGGGGSHGDRPRRTGSVLGVPGTHPELMTGATASASSSATGSASASAGGGQAGGSGGGSGGGFRCHHMIAEENHDPGWSAEGGAAAAATSSPQHVVQRTHSNPEMECCPVCLARNQCEILLKRTYSKVHA